MRERRDRAAAGVPGGRQGTRPVAGRAGGGPLQVVLGEISRYLSVLVLIRVTAEITATVLVTAVLVHWIAHAPDWRAYLIALPS